ncbi:hypothetical protein BDF21DRAFT_404011 [Thamnidium elegans]|nr:hypothetical protein BDF21DRAFT_404011 [Thamnidium elegans]
MDAYSIITILSSAYEYTQDQSIAENDDSGHSISVVPLKLLEKHLQNDEREMYQLVIKTHQSLVRFLRYKKTKDLNKKWNYGITTQSKYEKYCCSFDLQYNCLKDETYLDEDLFVIHRFKKQADKTGRKNNEEELCQEIFECSQNYFLNEYEYSCREDIKNTFDCAFKLNFPNIGAIVELIGTSKYQLDFIHEDLKLVIRIKDSYGHYVDLDNKDQSFYDAEFLSGYLTSMGIKNSNIDRFNNGCTFIGLHGISCHIRIINKDVIFERDQLILEYLKLDKRIKPLCKKLSTLRRPKLLDPSEPIVMVLDFLEKGLESPLIPNLRNIGIDCKSSDCLYNTHKKNQVHTSYHTCIRIENNKVGKKYSNLEYNGIKPTIWYSDNGDNLATLLKDFFKYYLQRDNFFAFIEPNENHTVNDIPYVNYKNNKYYKAHYSWMEVSIMFSKASESLQAGKGFQYICGE